MKVTNTSKDMSFDVIYADGMRRRVLITSGTINLLKRAAVTMPWLFEGTGFNPLNADVANIVAITRPDHAIRHRGESVLTAAETQAIFRLGQMDMQQSVVDMLTANADSIFGSVRATLLDAAERVRQMEVLK